MYYVKERADKIIQQLKDLITVQNVPIERCKIKKGFFVNPQEADAAAKLLEQEMMNAMTLRVPLTVEVKKGASWYDAH